MLLDSKLPPQAMLKRKRIAYYPAYNVDSLRSFTYHAQRKQISNMYGIETLPSGFNRTLLV